MVCEDWVIDIASNRASIMVVSGVGEGFDIVYV